MLANGLYLKNKKSLKKHTPTSTSHLEYILLKQKKTVNKKPVFVKRSWKINKTEDKIIGGDIIEKKMIVNNRLKRF